jgi:hypothetical protein
MKYIKNINELKVGIIDPTFDIEKSLIHELRPKNRIRKIKNIFN